MMTSSDLSSVTVASAFASETLPQAPVIGVGAGERAAAPDLTVIRSERYLDVLRAPFGPKPPTRRLRDAHACVHSCRRMPCLSCKLLGLRVALLFTCTPVTAAMNLLDGTLGATACPTIISDASGLRATITGFAANSGVRITYTAKAPATITSTPNIANLYADATLATASDRSAWANLLVRPIAPVVTPPKPAPTLASTGVDPVTGQVTTIVGLLSLLLGIGVLSARRWRRNRGRGPLHH